MLSWDILGSPSGAGTENKRERAVGIPTPFSSSNFFCCQRLAYRIQPLGGTSLGMKSRIMNSLGIEAHEESVSPSLAQLLQQKLLRCSVRWLNASATLWSLIVNDSQRAATQATLSQFLDVMSWRAHDKINAEEFSVLHAEWMQHAGSVLDQSPARPPAPSAKTKGFGANKPHQLPVNVFRALLLEKRTSEADLDLFIGLMLNELNLKLLHATISYHSSARKHGSGGAKMGSGSSALSVVTHKWLQLSEELFFSVDIAGHGHWGFDEAFFFVACLTMGLQAWSHIVQCESDLSLVTLTALTAQFLRDAGVCVTGGVAGSLGRNGQTSTANNGNSTASLGGGASSRRPPLTTGSRRGGFVLHSGGNGGGGGSGGTGVPSQFAPAALQHGYQPGNSYALTLAQFKRHLLLHHVDEFQLQTLLSHVYTTVDRCIALCRASGASELCLSCLTLDERLSVRGRSEEAAFGDGVSAGPAVLGPMRLWQEAVLVAAGLEPAAALESGGADRGGAGVGASAALPPPVVFLLSDAPSALGMIVRAIDFPVHQQSFVSRSQTGTATSAAALGNAELGNEEVRDTAAKLAQMFRLWTAGQQLPSAAHAVGAQGVASSADSGGAKDPVFQLFCHVLMQYKHLQQLCCAALFDTAVSLFGAAPAQVALEPGTRAPPLVSPELAAACAGLLPQEEPMLLELGAFPPSPPVDEDADSAAAAGAEPPLAPGSSEEKMSIDELAGTGTGTRDAASLGAAADAAATSSSAAASSGETRRPRYFKPTAAALARSLPLPPQPLAGSPFAQTPAAQLASATVGSSSSAPQRRGDAGATDAALVASRPTAAVSAQWTTLLDLRPAAQRAASADVAHRPPPPALSVSRTTASLGRSQSLIPVPVAAASGPRRAQSLASAPSAQDDARPRDHGEWPRRPPRAAVEPENEALPASPHLSAAVANASAQSNGAEQQLLEQLLSTADLQSQLLLLEQLKRSRQDRRTDAAQREPAPQTPPPLSASQLSSRSQSAASSPQQSLRSSPSASTAPSSTSFAAADASGATSAGQVAHLLRGILRKMSTGESGRLKLQSLEEVLQLGNALLMQDHPSGAPQRGGVPAQPSQPKRQVAAQAARPAVGPVRDVDAQTPLRSHSDMFRADARAADDGSGGFSHSSYPTEPRAIARPTPTPTISPANLGSSGLRRTSRAPGTVPDIHGRKSARVFGHPVSK